jgi:hypothetical protein
MSLKGIIFVIVVVMVGLGVLLTVAAFTLGPAAIVTCSGGPCRGTEGPDLVDGTTSEDVIYGAGGSDIINTVIGDEPPSSEDRVYAGKGNDRLVATDSSPDVIDCGKGGKDTVFFDTRGTDTVEKNCEIRNPPT